MAAPAGWTISLAVPRHAVGLFARGLETLGTAVSARDSGNGLWSVTAFTPAAPDRTALTAALALATRLSGIPEPVAEVAPLADIDWLAENRRSFAPVEAGRFFIHPDPFDGRTPAGAVALALNAGAAFGTGSHASTRGCLHALDRLHRRGLRFSRMLDVGCGSGILAIAAARLWKRPVTAVDIDPVSVAVTRANARANEVGPLVSAHRADGAGKRGNRNHRLGSYRVGSRRAGNRNAGRLGSEKPGGGKPGAGKPGAGKPRAGGRYGLVVANILAQPLIAMAGDIAGRCTPGGAIVLSGITDGQTAALQTAYRRPGLRLLEKIAEEGWTTLVLERVRVPADPSARAAAGVPIRASGIG